MRTTPPSITAGEFKAMLLESGLNATAFAKLTGARTKRVNQWLIGDIAVPFWVPSWLQLWARLLPPQRAGFIIMKS